MSELTNARARFKALRHIPAGEELTIDYAQLPGGSSSTTERRGWKR